MHGTCTCLEGLRNEKTTAKATGFKVLLVYELPRSVTQLCCLLGAVLQILGHLKCDAPGRMP